VQTITKIYCRLPFKTTIRDIADELKLTPVSASRALHNHPHISAETKRLVAETARRLNCRRNKIASSVRTGKSHSIGVIIPSASINFFGSVLHGIKMLASEHGYHTLIYQSDDSTNLEIKAIQAFPGARMLLQLIEKNTKTTVQSKITLEPISIFRELSQRKGIVDPGSKNYNKFSKNLNIQV